MEEELKVQPQDFKGRLIFMSMYNDIGWTSNDNQELCRHSSSRVAEDANSFPKGHWSFLAPGCDKKSGILLLLYKQYGAWDRVAEDMVGVIPEKRASGYAELSRRPLKSKGGGKTSIQNTAEPQTGEFLLSTFVSVNQLSNYAAVADWCQELTSAIPFTKHGETCCESVS